MDLGLKGKIALITGGSRGIGKATALLLAGEGARLAIAARGAETLSATAAEVRAVGGEVITIQADFCDPAESARAVAETVAAYGGLDILIANAGGSFGERELASASDADWEKTFRFNVGHAIAALREARQPREVALVVNELTPESRSALADRYVEMVIGTPLNTICRNLFTLAHQARASEGVPLPGQTFLRPHIHLSLIHI